MRTERDRMIGRLRDAGAKLSNVAHTGVRGAALRWRRARPRRGRKQGFDMPRNLDVGATMAQASQAMTQAQQYLAASTPAVRSSADEARRTFTTATVTAAQEAPMTIGMNLLVHLELIVQLPGGVPLPVQRTEQLSPLHLARVAPGARLEVSLVPGMPESLRIEWGA